MKEYLISFVSVLRQLVYFVILIRIILSWLRNPYNKFTRFIYSIADPILMPFKRIIPPIGMIDISPIVAVIVIDFAFKFLLRLLNTL